MSEPVPREVHARQLADEMKTLVPGMERLAAIATELRADDLYRTLGFGTWEAFCTEYVGVSKRTVNRWITPPKPRELDAPNTDGPKSKGAGQSVAAGHFVPVSESKALNFEKGSADDGPPAPPAPRPTAQKPERSADRAPTRRTPSRSSGDGSSAPPSRSRGGKPADGLTATGISDADGLRWLAGKTEQQIRALGDPLGPAIRGEIKRWAHAFGFFERVTASAMASRRAKEAASNGHGHVKSHDAGCSCLMCKPAVKR